MKPFTRHTFWTIKQSSTPRLSSTKVCEFETEIRECGNRNTVGLLRTSAGNSSTVVAWSSGLYGGERWSELTKANSVIEVANKKSSLRAKVKFLKAEILCITEEEEEEEEEEGEEEKEGGREGEGEEEEAGGGGGGGAGGKVGEVGGEGGGEGE